jgi:hypothetical protein
VSHQDEIGCVLSCFDRVVITGTLPDICHPKAAMAGYLSYRDIRLFDYARWAEPLGDQVRANAERLAAEAGLEIEFIRKLKAFRKEDRVQAILDERGDHPGLVHIFSAMEACSSYRPWYDKASGKTLFKPISGKCLHYYIFSGLGWGCYGMKRAEMSLDVLYLLAHLLDQDLHLYDQASDLHVGGLRPEGVCLTVELLHQKVQAATYWPASL